MESFDTIVKRLSENRLWQFPGGVKPQDKKALSNTHAIRRLPLPDCLYIPLKQHIGNKGSLIVEVGQRVLKGQPLTKASGPYSVPIHASTSGTVKAIDEHVSAHPSGIAEPTLMLEPDGLDEWIKLHPNPHYSQLDKSTLVELICDAGISGMGGAGFPTHIKTNNPQKLEFLIINGIECEPYITADDRLMREHAWQIRQGIDILQHTLNPKHIIVAVEDNKPEALEALRIACKDKPDCSLVSTPTLYPMGGEKQLIQVVTGREVPGKGLPSDIGITMFNIGTCFAIADAVFNGKPLIERVVTLTGEAVKAPQNVWALIGTPIAFLTEHAQLKSSKRYSQRIIMGGPMMGFTVTSPRVPVVKTTNCLLMPKASFAQPEDIERPCIRCSACSDVCPASLLPQQLLWHSKAKEYDKAQDYNLFDCIECGACAYVCPSDIPLVQYYRQAKSAVRSEKDEKQKAEKAKARFDARTQRLENDKKEREEKHQKAAQARQNAKANANDTATETTTAPKSAAVAAAIARAKAKKQQTSTPVLETEQKEPAQVDDKKAKVAAAVARAKAKKAASSNAIESEEKLESNTEAPQQTEVDDKKAKIAAAVARAKAKKAAASNGVEPNEKTAPTIETTQQTDADAKKAKVAAAVARAKAKAKAKAEKNAE
ncbi:electron transport complex subunit RsxC [Alteromonas sp. 5E99-2]|uniref:electron transport complex subunit RsxC n=1 Tax=Alteromonas sp. 5E99-2 TaxID=2817683 RepID=UPI001A994BAA|nr:electron transport complex subunit RsxC [Alteromonas sp. 5E99-2]MBO1256031.1 electron transport complex subunit RsxC [Alteromonas sp. 5E99-2]